MSQQVRCLLLGLVMSSVPKTHTVGGERWLLKLFSDLYIQVMVYEHAHTQAHIHTQCFKM